MARIGNVSIAQETKGFNRYYGVAPVKVVAVNPTKAELEKIYSYSLEKEPEYLTKITIEGKEYDAVRINFICKIEPFNSPFTGQLVEIEDFVNLNFLLVKRKRISQLGKVQVCNAYGATTWLDPQNVESKTSPYAWYLTDGMRPAIQGEDGLIEFLRTLLNVSSAFVKQQDGTYKPIDDLSVAEFQLENIADYFKGNVKELKEIINLLPEAKVKVCFGVRSSDTGAMYQDFFNRNFLRSNVKTYTYLENKVTEAKANGAFPNTEFHLGDLKVYTVNPTNFEKGELPAQEPSDADLPF